MRTFGRDATGAWVVLTDDGLVWLATLVQTLRLIEGESQFFANYGLPAIQSVITQIAPDAAVARTQAQFSPHFASLTIARDNTATEPTYNVRAVLLDGTVVNASTVAT